MCNDLFMYQLKCFYILKVKRNSNYQKWAHLLSFCCLTFVSTFITTRSYITLRQHNDRHVHKKQHNAANRGTADKRGTEHFFPRIWHNKSSTAPATLKRKAPSRKVGRPSNATPMK